MVRAEPFQSTTDPETKFVPFTVSVKPELPASVDVGEIEVVVGIGLLIVNVCAAEVPPPGAGVTTVTDTVPAIAMSVAGTIAVNVVLVTNVVESGDPFQSAVEEAKKLDPLSVNVNCAPPAVVDVGLMESRTGVELRTVNVWEFDVPPPGAEFVTVTG